MVNCPGAFVHQRQREVGLQRLQRQFEHRMPVHRRDLRLRIHHRAGHLRRLGTEHDIERGRRPAGHIPALRQYVQVGGAYAGDIEALGQAVDGEVIAVRANVFQLKASA
jgi:hypothetical protein